MLTRQVFSAYSQPRIAVPFWFWRSFSFAGPEPASLCDAAGP